MKLLVVSALACGILLDAALVSYLAAPGSGLSSTFAWLAALALFGPATLRWVVVPAWEGLMRWDARDRAEGGFGCGSIAMIIVALLAGPVFPPFHEAGEHHDHAAHWDAFDHEDHWHHHA